MSNFFLVLWLAALIALIIGLIKPKKLEGISKKFYKGDLTKKSIGIVLGAALLILFILVGATAPKVDDAKQTNTPTPAKQEETKKDDRQLVTVKRVVDGDTIELEDRQKLRYIGIDTPETVDPRTTVQCFGKEASDKNKSLVEGKKVKLEKDVSETDKYGRLLRYVYLEDDTFINLVLVKEGFAKSSSYPPDIKHQEEFKKAE